MRTPTVALVAVTPSVPAPVTAAAVARPAPAALTQPTADAPAHVVIISEDGMRPDVLTVALAPRHVQLMAEGAMARLAQTIPESDTLPSHASMLSGVGVKRHGLFWNHLQPDKGYIHVPTVFSAAHAEGLSTAMFVGKPKLRHIASPGTVDHYERPGYFCAIVVKHASAYWATTQPDLMFVHFSDPDEFGHSDGWMSAAYTQAVTASDDCLATMLDAIDHSPAAASTLVIVTADHGGHGKHHSGGHDEVDRQIPWIARGPGLAPGTILDERIDTVDTAATTLAALGLPALPNMVGAARLTFKPSR